MLEKDIATSEPLQLQASRASSPFSPSYLRLQKLSSKSCTPFSGASWSCHPFQNNYTNFPPESSLSPRTSSNEHTSTVSSSYKSLSLFTPFSQRHALRLETRLQSPYPSSSSCRSWSPVSIAPSGSSGPFCDSRGCTSRRSIDEAGWSNGIVAPVVYFFTICTTSSSCNSWSNPTFCPRECFALVPQTIAYLSCFAISLWMALQKSSTVALFRFNTTGAE